MNSARFTQLMQPEYADELSEAITEGYRSLVRSLVMNMPIEESAEFALWDFSVLYQDDPAAGALYALAEGARP